MSQLQQEIDVVCPLGQAGSRLQRFFRVHGNPDGDVLTLDLRADIKVPVLDIPLSFECPVVATVQSKHRPADMTPRFSVQWAPAKPGPYPLFNGELLVEGDDDYNSFTLRLSGSYEPPLGVVGKGFDVVVGNRIAHETATNLLRLLKEGVERDFRADEDRKPNVQCAT